MKTVLGWGEVSPKDRKMVQDHTHADPRPQELHKCVGYFLFQHMKKFKMGVHTVNDRELALQKKIFRSG